MFATTSLVTAANRLSICFDQRIIDQKGSRERATVAFRKSALIASSSASTSANSTSERRCRWQIGDRIIHGGAFALPAELANSRKDLLQRKRLGQQSMELIPLTIRVQPWPSTSEAVPQKTLLNQAEQNATIQISRSRSNLRYSYFGITARRRPFDSDGDIGNARPDDAPVIRTQDHQRYFRRLDSVGSSTPDRPCKDEPCFFGWSSNAPFFKPTNLETT